VIRTTQTNRLSAIRIPLLLAAAFIFALVAALPSAHLLKAADTSASFHDAPASAAQMKNPYASQQQAATAGASLFTINCAQCHGPKGGGQGNVPSLRRQNVQSASDGEIFWFITQGDIKDGMPAWDSLPKEERWQIVTFVKSLANTNANSKTPTPAASTVTAAPPPPAPASSPATASSQNAQTAQTAQTAGTPFSDYRVEAPGKFHKITVADLPAPYATKSANNGPRVVERPANAWPKAPSGFTVQQYATGLENPRLIRTAPNGDFFVAEMEPGDIKVFRGITPDGKSEHVEVFASGLNEPYGIAFYPPGPNPQYVYIGDTDEVLRFPYQNGDLKARGPAQRLAELPHGAGHSTRDIQFTNDGQKMFVAVGSASNVDDGDAEKNRANILQFNPDGTAMRIYASGIRNPGGGLAVDPKSGELWCSVNERDGLGDNLVPDYITHVQDGGFYGWPWWYMGGHQDPRHEGKHPELKDKVITPDVILQAHNASLELTFYGGKQFPAEYQGDIFASEHGSWNRSTRAGYEVIRVPRHQTSRASGDFEDFVTGFVLGDGSVWGRPVGITVATDGSLLVTDDGSNSIWRIAYAGK
jgi:glucose/arabinose dehydrogenase